MNRRTLLRGAAGACVGLPFLNLMEGHAASTTDVKRLVFVFTNNGTVLDSWKPTGSETDPVYGPILAPLNAHKQDILVLSGLDQESSYHGPGSGDPHMPGMAHLLTGTEMVDTGPGQYEKMGGGISVDQFVAQQLDPPTKFSTLGFGVQAREFSAHAWNGLSYLGPNQPVDPEDDPVKAFDRVFMDLDADDGQLAVLRAQRHSVLDAVKEDITSLQGRLGADDKARLDQHLNSIREVEKIIDSGTGVGGNCQLPDQPSAIPGSLYDNANAPTLWRVQTELLVMALACDLTRVATLQWREALGGNSTFSWLGHGETHHDISHKGDGDSVGRQQMTDINVWFAEQFAYLLDLMSQVQEVDGTLLDNSAVVWVNELSRGNAHSRRDMPFLIAGSACNHFRTGRWLDYSALPQLDKSHNNLLVSLCNAMDVNVSSFGNPAYCTGPLTNLT